MGFQYDSDDLGYEWGYDKPSNLPSETTQNFMGEGDSPIVYECQVPATGKAPPPAAPVVPPSPAAPAAADRPAPAAPQAPKIVIADGASADSPELIAAKKQLEAAQKTAAAAQSRFAAFGDKANAEGKMGDKKTKDELDGLKQLRDDAKAKVETAQKEVDRLSKKSSTKQAGAANAAADTGRAGKAHKAVAAKRPEPPVGSAEAAKRQVLPNYKTLQGSDTKLGDVTKNLLHDLNEATTGKGWGTPKLGAPIQKGGKTYQTLSVTHSTAGKADNTIVYTGNREAGSDSWELGTTVPPPTKEQTDAKAAEIHAAKTEAQTALKGQKSKDEIKTALKGWTVEDKDIDEKTGTVTATHPKAGKFTFKISGEKGEKVDVTDEPKVNRGDHHESKPSKSTAEFALEGEFRKEGARPQTIETYEKETFPSDHKAREEHVQKQTAEFKSYKENPSNKGKGEFYLTVRLSTHYIKKIEEKLGTAETEKTMLARGFVIERTPTGGRKVFSRELSDGTIRPLNESDLAELSSLNQQVQSDSFNLQEFTEDNQRRAAVNDYLHQVPAGMRETAREVLSRMDYIGSDGKPTKFDVQSFRTAMFSGYSAGTQAPTAQALAPFATTFREYQNEFQRLENERNGLKKAHADSRARGRTDARTDADIDKEYAVRQAELKDKFDAKMKANLASADPSTRAYVQEQLKAAGYYPENDPNKKPKADWNAEKFAETVTAAPFNATVQDYQKATDANEKARQTELARFKPTETAKIAEVNGRYNKKAEDLKKDLDKKITALKNSADPVTFKYITKKLQSVGYYKNDKLEVDPNWSKDKQDQFIKDTSAPAVPTAGVARLPNQSEIREIASELQDMQKDLKKNPENAPEILKKYQERMDAHIAKLEKSDPITASYLKQMKTNGYVDSVHNTLINQYGFTDGDARAVEYSWGLRDHPEGKASTKVDSNVAREKFEYLTGAKFGGIPPSVGQVRREAFKAFRQKLATAVSYTGVDGKTASRAMIGKDYLGEEDQRKPGTLASMARDVDRIETARATGDKVALTQIGEEYTKAAEGVTMPAGGVAANQAKIIENKVDTLQANQVPSPDGAVAGAGGTDNKGDGATAGATPVGGKGKTGKKGAKETEADKRLKQDAAQHKDRDGNEKSRIGIEKDRLGVEKDRLALERKRIENEDLRAAERAEIDREKMAQEKEMSERKMAFDAKEGEKNRQSQLTNTMIQGLFSLLSSMIQAALGMLGQVVAASHQVLAANIQVTHGPRGGR